MTSECEDAFDGHPLFLVVSFYPLSYQKIKRYSQLFVWVSLTGELYIPGTQKSLVLVGKDLLLEAKQRTNGFQVRMHYKLLDIYGNQFLLLHYDQHRQTLLSRCHGYRGCCSNCGSSTASTESCWSICRFGM